MHHIIDVDHCEEEPLTCNNPIILLRRILNPHFHSNLTHAKTFSFTLSPSKLAWPISTFSFEQTIKVDSLPGSLNST